MKPVSQFRAIGYAILGFALWVLTDSCMKIAGEAQLPPWQIVACLGFIGTLIMVVRGVARGNLRQLWPKKPRAQLGRSMLAVVTSIFNVIALKHLPLTLFYVSVFCAPLMIAILAALFLKEHLSWQKSLAVIAGFAGVVIAINPFQEISHGSWIGYGAAFTSMACFATSVIWLRRMTQSESSESIVFFAALVELICGGIGCLGHVEPITPKLLLILTAMGGLCIAGNLAVYSSLRYTTAANVSQFHYTQIVTGALMGYLVWNEVPTLHLLLGIAVIIGSGLTIASHARKADNLASIGQK